MPVSGAKTALLWEAPRQSEPWKEQTHGTGLGMFTLTRKEPGGAKSDRRVSERLQPLPPPSEPLGGEKFIFPPRLIIAGERRGRQINDSAE